MTAGNIHISIIMLCFRFSTFLLDIAHSSNVHVRDSFLIDYTVSFFLYFNGK